MKRAHPIKDKASAPGTGNSIIGIGSFPAKLATVTAEVLARLLAGEPLTSLDAVFGASTTRLAAIVFHLETHHGWTIAREDLTAGCRDGRVAWIRSYHLSADVIALANKAGAAQWCDDVGAARLKLRAKVEDAHAYAARANAAAKGGKPAAKPSLLDGQGVGGPPVPRGATTDPGPDDIVSDDAHVADPLEEGA